MRTIPESSLHGEIISSKGTFKEEESGGGKSPAINVCGLEPSVLGAYKPLLPTKIQVPST